MDVRINSQSVETPIKTLQQSRGLNKHAMAAWSGRALMSVVLLFTLVITMGSEAGQRSLLAFSIFGILLVLTLGSPRVGFPIVLAYVVLLGGIRRWLSPYVNAPSNDPLLLVVPGIVGVYFSRLLILRKVPRDTRLARLLYWLLVVMALEIFNPLQGGLMVGLAGVLFLIVPLLWYYVGRGIGNADVLEKLIYIVIVVALVSALYGMKQTFIGFSDSEMIWLKANLSTFAALNPTAPRAFAFYASPAEYIWVMSAGFVFLWALVLCSNRLAALPLPLLGWAMFITGMRGPIVTTLFTCAILWAVQRRNIRSWLPRMAIAGAIAVAGLTWSLQQVEVEQLSPVLKDNVGHQVQGLLKPQESTAGGHISMVFNGILSGFRNPIGLGLGASTLAANRFEGNVASSEGDWGNSFISLGLVGGLLYMAFIWTTFAKAFAYWQASRRFIALAMLGLLLVEFGHWIQGELYTTSLLCCLYIGMLDRIQPEPQKIPQSRP